MKTINKNNIKDVYKSKITTEESARLKGYTMIKELFCDSSGFGQDNETALTQTQLEKELQQLTQEHSILYTAITRAGMFQVYVGIFLKTGKRIAKKIANNTYQYTENNTTTIRLHDTDIIKINHNKNTITLNNGEWYTNTTKNRMNDYINAYGYQVQQKAYNWYIKNLKTNIIIEYKNNITLPCKN